jgi:hypothetical protein
MRNYKIWFTDYGSIKQATLFDSNESAIAHYQKDYKSMKLFQKRAKKYFENIIAVYKD